VGLELMFRGVHVCTVGPSIPGGLLSFGVVLMVVGFLFPGHL